MGRRAFLASLLAAFAAFAALAAGRARPRAERGAQADGPLAGVLRSPRSAAAVGARYVRDHPEERGAALALTGAWAARAREPALARRALQREGARDFALGRVVRVDGWVLSRTEARLCAAVWLAGRG